MGEYAIYKKTNERIKIGTCEDMYYLRADQADTVRAESGSVNPLTQAEHIRFRFPFPQEDGMEPGSFEPFTKLGVSGVEPPEIEHYAIQFTANSGILVSLPCPESKEGKALGVKFHYNGYSGKVQIVQQRLVQGKLVLICQCGSCGAAYRCPTLEDAQPVIDSLLNTAKYEDSEAERDRIRHDNPKLVSRGDYYREVARRIVAGYTDPNLWTERSAKAA